MVVGARSRAGRSASAISATVASAPVPEHAEQRDLEVRELRGVGHGDSSSLRRQM